MPSSQATQPEIPPQPRSQFSDPSHLTENQRAQPGDEPVATKKPSEARRASPRENQSKIGEGKIYLAQQQAQRSPRGQPRENQSKIGEGKNLFLPGKKSSEGQRPKRRKQHKFRALREIWSPWWELNSRSRPYQGRALPLSHTGLEIRFSCSSEALEATEIFDSKILSSNIPTRKIGAGDGSRTRNPQLGRLIL